MPPPTTPLRKSITIDEGVLVSMAFNKAFLREFPFLEGVKGALKKLGGAKGCGSCGRSASARSQILSSAKQTLATMDSSKKRKLREMLHTERVKIIYQERGTNKVRELVLTGK